MKKNLRVAIIQTKVPKSKEEGEKQIKEKYGQTIREFRGLNEKYY